MDKIIKASDPKVRGSSVVQFVRNTYRDTKLWDISNITQP